LGIGELTAMAIAMLASVTVSMGEEMRGAFREIFLVRAEDRSCENNKQCHMHL